MTVIGIEEDFPEELLTTDTEFQCVYPIAHQAHRIKKSSSLH